jgi:glycosyltransferase involved in cell wall biosynthesis
MRVFIGLTEVAGYFGNLAKGLEELGIETKFVDLYAHPFRYAGDAAPRDRLVDLYRALARRRAMVPASRQLRVLWWAGLQKACAMGILFKAALTCDVFIFSSDTTFLRYLDLPILRLLRKRLIFVFSGSDHRPPYMDGVAVTALDDETVARCGVMTTRVKAKLRKIEGHADVIVGHHLSAHLHERRIVPFLLLGIPFATAARPVPATSERASSPVRIVHAPSTPRQKGTREIREAVEALRASGLAIELVELVNQRNQVVLDELARCDFVVDELYSDSRMAGLATEAAFFGKPTVVGGYARDEDMAIDGVYPASSFAPVHHCHPAEIKDAIFRLVTDISYRIELGERAREFVTANWSPSKVARRYVALIENEIPESWMFDPRDIRYVSGTGIPESVTRTAVRRLVEMRGVGALCLSDKPELEGTLLAFASGESADAPADADRNAPRPT